MKRRQLITNTAKGLGAITIASCSSKSATLITDDNFTSQKDKLKGTINHSVCKWCYRMPLEELAEAAQEIGLKSIELLESDEWPVVKKYGLDCAISNGANLGIPNGFNEPNNHEELLRQYTDLIPRGADFGLKQIICFSGNRRGMSDEQGMENAAVGLEPVVKLAEKHGITCLLYTSDAADE